MVMKRKKWKNYNKKEENEEITEKARKYNVQKSNEIESVSKKIKKMWKVN